jgi:hypothetical protein
VGRALREDVFAATGGPALRAQALSRFFAIAGDCPYTPSSDERPLRRSLVSPPGWRFSSIVQLAGPPLISMRPPIGISGSIGRPFGIRVAGSPQRLCWSSCSSRIDWRLRHWTKRRSHFSQG